MAPRLLQQCRQRAAVENIYEIRRHPAPLRYSLIAAYCWLRVQEITDSLVELLLQVVHRIGATSFLLARLFRVSGPGLLCGSFQETRGDS